MNLLGTLVRQRYFIYEKISASSFSELYLARDFLVKKTRVIKISSSCHSQESLYYRLLSHPLLPQCIDCWSENALDYLVLEYIPGKDLQELFIEKGPFSETFLIYLAFSASSFLSYLYQQRPPIYYCDCKPANFLLSSLGKLSIVDLGSAIQNPLGVSRIFGTKPFAPPEIYEGTLYPSSDLYALGKTIFSLKDSLSKETCQFPDFWNLLFQCIEDNPSVRPSSPITFHTALLQIFSLHADSLLSLLFSLS